MPFAPEDCGGTGRGKRILILSHATGNANVREAIRALNDVGLLSEFWTCVAWREDHPLDRVLPRPIVRELKRRIFQSLHEGQLHCVPWLETGRLIASRLNLSTLIGHKAGPFSVDRVFHDLDKKVAARLLRTAGHGAIYAYEDGALASFLVAERLGNRKLYELPIGYWRVSRELLEEEARLQPEWAVTLRGNSDCREKLHRKDEELALADHIIVPSEFVRRTLTKAPEIRCPISVIPYGAPPVRPPQRRNWRAGERLKVVFAGALSQRKGVSYLLQAIKQLSGGVELTLVGKRVGQCRPLDHALGVHRWIPSLPHADLVKEIGRHDVMVFPSLFEGFGLVVLEAMSQGVPVIATPNGAAPDLITDGKNGFIVPIRDPAAITARLDLLSHDRKLLAEMSHAAIQTAQMHSWDRYRERLARTVQEALLSEPPSIANTSPLVHANA